MANAIEARNSPAARVFSFDSEGFDEICAELLRVVEIDFRPDVLIGIRTGGLYVAQAMAKAASPPIPVLPITCRRPSTRYKPFSAAARKLVSGLPRPFLDRLRLVEHRLLTLKPAAPREPFQFDHAELAGLDAWVASRGAAPAMLIVDNSVDTGTTLSHVQGAVRAHAPPRALVRSAVITVTTVAPLIKPDYTLFNQKLCRFPWSLDAVARRAC